MGACLIYRKDNYVFEKFGVSKPSAVYRIDDSGKEIPLTMEEIIEVNKKYFPE